VNPSTKVSWEGVESRGVGVRCSMGSRFSSFRRFRGVKGMVILINKAGVEPRAFDLLVYVSFPRPPICNPYTLSERHTNKCKSISLVLIQRVSPSFVFDTGTPLASYLKNASSPPNPGGRSANHSTHSCRLGSWIQLRGETDVI
jgi:hypothetical protein